MVNSECPENWNYRDDCTGAQRKNWYSNVADAYNKTRPRYPQKIIDRAVELAQLSPNAKLLELGCGPGTATTALAKMGYSMVCLEPSREACQLARENCIIYPKVEIYNSTFEEWQLKNQFDAVVAASSFHWISSIKYLKAAAALKNDGYLILLWNTPPQPDYEVYEELREVYYNHAPSLERYEEIETHARNLRWFGQAAIDSGLFQNLISEKMICEVTYSIDDYLSLLSTLSPYIALEQQQQNDLFTGLKEILARHCGENMHTSYLSALHVVQKV